MTIKFSENLDLRSGCVQSTFFESAYDSLDSREHRRFRFGSAGTQEVDATPKFRGAQ